MMSLQESEKLAILKLLVWLAARDGTFADAEIAFLKETMQQLQIHSMPSLTKGLSEDPHPILQDIKTYRGKRLLLELLINMSFADGVYDGRERSALATSATVLSVPWWEIEGIEHDLVATFRSQLMEISSQELDEPKDSKSWDCLSHGRCCSSKRPKARQHETCSVG